MDYDLLVLASFRLSRSGGYYARGEIVTDEVSIQLIEAWGAHIQPKVMRIVKSGTDAVQEPFVLRMTDTIRIYRGLEYLTLRMREDVLAG